MTATTVAVHPERLLQPLSAPQRYLKGPSRSVLRHLLSRLSVERLLVREQFPGAEPAPVHGYGAPAETEAELCAEIVVRDARAYGAVLREGSIGLGRGYLEGWWDSPDPVAVVRVIIRNLRGLDEARNHVAQRIAWATDRVRAVLPRPDRNRNREDIAAHYDLGNAFFELFLDETMTYSAGVFPSMAASMAEASLHKYDLMLAKLSVQSKHHLLEIGTGWGAMAMRAVQQTGCRMTTTTISAAQLGEATRRVREAGLGDRVRLLDHDWRDLRGRHDRIVSIEMIEAVDWRDYDVFFRTIERCLAPDGLFACQVICLPDRRYQRAKNTEDFIRRFVFPNGCLASIGALSRAASRSTDLQMIDVEDLTAHYVETLSRWRDRFEANLDQVDQLGLDERFKRLWRFYLAYCEAGFRERHCTVNQIVFAGRDWRGTIPTMSALTPVY